MNAFLADLNAKAILQPASHFKNAAPWFSGAVALSLVALVFGLLQLALAFANAATIRSAADEWTRVAAATGALENASMYQVSPFRHLLLPIYWLFYAGLATLLRGLMARLQSGFADLGGLCRISAMAAIPYVVVGGLLQLIALLVPYSALQLSVTRIAFSVLALSFAFAAEGYIVIKALGAQRAMPTGQATLVWLTPQFLIMVIGGVFGLVAVAS